MYKYLIVFVLTSAFDQNIQPTYENKFVKFRRKITETNVRKLLSDARKEHNRGTIVNVQNIIPISRKD